MQNDSRIEIQDDEAVAVAGKVLGIRASRATIVHTTSLIDNKNCSATDAVLLVTGEAETSLGSRQWQAVLKGLHDSVDGSARWLSQRDVRSPYYWRRELLVNAAGLLNSTQSGLRSPRYLGHTNRPGWKAAFWAEFVGGVPAKQWQLPAELHRVRAATRHLGHMQGSLVVEQQVPRHRWLTDDFTTSYVQRAEVEMQLIDEPKAWRHPLMRLFRGELGTTMLQTWVHRQRTLEMLRSLPQTLTHNDFWLGNLQSPESATADETIAIDWAFAGRGPIGLEAGTFAMQTMVNLWADSRHTDIVIDTAWQGYRDGLALAGVPEGSVLSAQARLGFTAGASVKFSYLIGEVLKVANDHDYGSQRLRAWRARGIDTLEAAQTHRARVGESLCALDAESRLLQTNVELLTSSVREINLAS